MGHQVNFILSLEPKYNNRSFGTGILGCVNVAGHHQICIFIASIKAESFSMCVVVLQFGRGALHASMAVLELTM